MVVDTYRQLQQLEGVGFNKVQATAIIELAARTRKQSVSAVYLRQRLDLVELRLNLLESWLTWTVTGLLAIAGIISMALH